jgi:cellulose biosynthesis protein BcsQ
MKIISIANTTGGSGKSTTALAVAVAAAEYGRNVLLIDLDERANLTFQLAIENPRFTMLKLLLAPLQMRLQSSAQMSELISCLLHQELPH